MNPEPQADPCRLIEDDEVRRAARSIADRGFAEIEHFFDEAELAEAREQVFDLVRGADGGYVSVGGPASLRGTLLSQACVSQRMVALLAGLCRHQGIAMPASSEIKQVLRCLAGETGKRHAYYFHYDSFRITALVPVEIPTEGMTGDLVMFPNIRPSRSNYLLNSAEKFVLERRPTQSAIRFMARRSRRAIRVKLKPGSIYFFNGDQTLHANEPCDPRHVRATMLLHYGETHADHWLKTLRRARASARAAA